MKYPVCIAYVIIILAAAADAQSDATLQIVIDKLDLTSFNNSIGPRRKKDKFTFKDYGFSQVKTDSNKVTVSEKDNSWWFKVTLLDNKTEKIKICFEDKANDGGSYHTQGAYLLAPDKSGLLKASIAEDKACPKFAK